MISHLLFVLEVCMAIIYLSYYMRLRSLLFQLRWSMNHSTFELLLRHIGVISTAITHTNKTAPYYPSHFVPLFNYNRTGVSQDNRNKFSEIYTRESASSRLWAETDGTYYSQSRKLLHFNIADNWDDHICRLIEYMCLHLSQTISPLSFRPYLKSYNMESYQISLQIKHHYTIALERVVH